MPAALPGPRVRIAPSAVRLALAALVTLLTFAGSCPLEPAPAVEKVGDPPTFDPVEVDRPVLDLAVDLVTPELLGDVSDPELWEELVAASRRAAAPDPTGESDYVFSVYLGVAPGRVAPIGAEEAPLVLTFDTGHPDYVELLSTPQVPAADDGVYSVLRLVFIDQLETCTIVQTPEVSAEIVDEHKAKALKGGCCAVLAVAHSLVRKMGVIVRPEDATRDTDGDGVPDEWDPDFLRKVRRASGDDDDGKGLTDDEAEQAHEADWNDSWDVDQVDDDEELYEGADLACRSLKTRCDDLIARLATNDDVSMRIRGRDGKKGEEWGHRVPVESARFDPGPPCCCEIEITQTSRQEPAGQPDFTGIPFNPGRATYRICTDAAGKTTVTNTEFPGSTILRLVFDSFDEDPKNDRVRPTDQGDPGSALD